jgi:hypothetical protein
MSTTQGKQTSNATGRHSGSGNGRQIWPANAGQLHRWHEPNGTRAEIAISISVPFWVSIRNRVRRCWKQKNRCPLNTCCVWLVPEKIRTSAGALKMRRQPVLVQQICLRSVHPVKFPPLFSPNSLVVEQDRGCGLRITQQRGLTHTRMTGAQLHTALALRITFSTGKSQPRAFGPHRTPVDPGAMSPTVLGPLWSDGVVPTVPGSGLMASLQPSVSARGLMATPP